MTSSKFDISSPDKLYFPDSEITKGDILEYYQRISGFMLGYLKNRPLVLQRFPEGIDGESFYQKQVPDYFPDWIETVEVMKKGDGTKQQLVVCNDQDTLLYLVNQGTLTFHPWLSRKDRLDVPDRAVIDLDPSSDDPAQVRQAARVVCEALAEREIIVCPTTTGSSGYHLVIPLRRGDTFDQVRDKLKKLSDELVQAHPDLLTAEQRKKKRGDKVYLDIARNAYAQTSVSIYSVRALPGAPVATPLTLAELDRSELSPRSYTVDNIFRRLAQKKVVWGKTQLETQQRL